MGQFLGELRDLPKVPEILNWKERARYFRSLSRNGSKEYLNVQFGWLPFVNDLRKFGHTVKSADTQIDNFLRNSGRNIRRRYTFPTESSTIVTELGKGYGSPVLVTQLYQHPGDLTKEVRTETKRWFSGCFTYYVPPLTYKSAGVVAEQLASKLYGLRVTPDLVWKLAPWSWAVDWVSNVGDVVHNFSAFSNDGLVMRYGYVMEHKSVITTWTLKEIALTGAGSFTLHQFASQSVKTRRRATPYGFGLNSSDFSAKQWSIIAALGISRKPRAL
jgi:hypothetical protein